MWGHARGSSALVDYRPLIISHVSHVSPAVRRSESVSLHLAKLTCAEARVSELMHDPSLTPGG